MHGEGEIQLEKGFGWGNPINSMDAGCLWVHEGCQIRLGEGIWMGKSY